MINDFIEFSYIVLNLILQKNHENPYNKNSLATLNIVYNFFLFSDPLKLIIKRLIGLENDTIFNSKHSHLPVKIPKGQCWIEGDNYCSSVDSIEYGPINCGLIFGKATHIVYPLHRLRSLRDELTLLQESKITSYLLGEIFYAMVDLFSN